MLIMVDKMIPRFGGCAVNVQFVYLFVFNYFLIKFEQMTIKSLHDLKECVADVDSVVVAFNSLGA